MLLLTPACGAYSYLVADDMRPELGAYGHSFMKTPHLDELARTGLTFDFAYTQFSCERADAPRRPSAAAQPAPSPLVLKAGAVLQIAHLLATVSSTNATSTALHASPDPALLPPAFMSGRRPDRTRALNFLSTFRRCSCPCYPHAYDPAVREQQCPEKCPPGCGKATTRFISFTSEARRWWKREAGFVAVRAGGELDEHAGVLQAEWILDHIRGQGLSRRPGRSAELDLREQPNRVRIISPAKRRLLHTATHARLPPMHPRPTLTSRTAGGWAATRATCCRRT